VQNLLLLSKRSYAIIPVGNLKVDSSMKEKPDVLQGTLALMVLKTLEVLGPQHGYGTSCNSISTNVSRGVTHE
jgi:hypothetical protein